MKFNIMIGGVETFFPENDVCYFKEKNKMVIYFLKTKQENIEKIIKNMKNQKLKLEDNFLILNLKEFQYAFDMRGYEKIMDFYNTGGKIGFAFEDESGNLLDIPTPTYYK